MKNFLKAAGFAFALTGMFVACESDPCKDVVCGNGTCVDGTCACDAGYEKDADGSCTVESRAKMLGTYAVAETCGAASTAYLALVANGTAVTDVNISNFWGVFINNVVATVDGDAITIASQEPDGDNYFVDGSGTFSKGATTADDKITMSYTITEKDDAGAVLSTTTCTAVFDRS